MSTQARVRMAGRWRPCARIVSASTSASSASRFTTSSRTQSKSSSSSSGHSAHVQARAKSVPGWSTLTASQKAVRATQQSANLALIFVGAGLTAGIGYALFSDLIAPDGRTRLFNAAVKKVRADKRVVRALTGVGSGVDDENEQTGFFVVDSLFSWSRWANQQVGRAIGSATDGAGDGVSWQDAAKSIYAYGEATGSKWSRNRSVADLTWTDAGGIEHIRMQFHVRGVKNEGLCQLHVTLAPGRFTPSALIKDTLSLLSTEPESRGGASSTAGDGDARQPVGTRGQRPWFGTGVEYEYMYVDVPGHQRFVIEDRHAESEPPHGHGTKLRFLGVQWR